jgi:hypothetical protein
MSAACADYSVGQRWPECAIDGPLSGGLATDRFVADQNDPSALLPRDRQQRVDGLRPSMIKPLAFGLDGRRPANNGRSGMRSIPVVNNYFASLLSG